MNKKIEKALEPIFMPVEKVPMSDLVKDPDILFSGRNSHAIIVTNKKGERVVVNSCSGGYTLVDNRELIEPIIEALTKEYDVEVKSFHRNNSRFWVDVKFLGMDTRIAKDDIIPRLRWVNSYDGGLKLSISMGLERVVCENGMTVPDEAFENVRMSRMHTLGIEDDIDDIMETAESFINNLHKVKEVYEKLAKVKLSKDNALKQLELLTERKFINKKLQEVATDRLLKEAEMGMPINQWLVYNSANFAINHNDSKTMPHKRDKQDLVLINHMIKTLE